MLKSVKLLKKSHKLLINKKNPAKSEILCPEQDSNLHTVTGATPSKWYVYQFHHLGIFNFIEIAFVRKTNSLVFTHLFAILQKRTAKIQKKNELTKFLITFFEENLTNRLFQRFQSALFFIEKIYQTANGKLNSYRMSIKINGIRQRVIYNIVFCPYTDI